MTTEVCYKPVGEENNGWRLKHLLKKLVIPVIASRPVSSLVTHLIGDGIPIFMLHRVTMDEKPGVRHTPAFLRRCLDYLGDNRFNFVSIETIIACLHGDASLPPKPVAFTLDDGFMDQATIAAPIFMEYNCPVTIFLTTGMLDGKLWPWFDQVGYFLANARNTVISLKTSQGLQTLRLRKPEERLRVIHFIRDIMKEMADASIAEMLDHLTTATQVEIPDEVPEEHRPLTWNMARQLEKKGVRFGPHTVSHRILSRLDAADMKFEITASWQRLREELVSPCPVFCYPNGKYADFGDREIETVKETGFIGALSSLPKQVNRGAAGDHLFRLPRLALPKSFDDFVQYCGWIQHAKEMLRQNAP
jgi:peptidoglycan/xylan/chitin deacetylase (PgdA/CDA1 family)